MHYVTSFERYGLKKGRQEGMPKKSREDILDILQLRFEQVPVSLRKMIEALDDPAVLKQLLQRDVMSEKTNCGEDFLTSG